MAEQVLKGKPLSITAPHEEDPIDAPPGYQEKRGADYNPLDLPNDHPNRVKLEKGMVLFRSEKLGTCIPFDPPQDRVEPNGGRVRVKQGQVVRFQNGEFWADPRIELNFVHNGQKKTMNQVEALRYAVKFMAGSSMIREITLDMMNPDHKQHDEEVGRIEAFEQMDVSAIRNLFEPHEIEQHKLEKAGKDRLILWALRLNKFVPPDYRDGDQELPPGEF